MTINQLFVVGDSLSRRANGDFTQAFLGGGDWEDHLTEMLATLIGPRLSAGIRGVWLSSEWAYSSGWTNVTSSDAFDIVPYNCSTTVPAKYGNGSTKTLTWTKPPGIRTMVGFNLYLVDKTSAGEISYSIDGGTFTNTGQTFLGDNKHLIFYVATPITSSLVIRCANAAGTAHDGLPWAIDPVYDATSTSGLITHNIAITGQQLRNLVASSSGDRLSIFKPAKIKYGTGSPRTIGPNLGIVLMHLNDVGIGSTSTWASDLSTFNSAVTGLAPIAVMSPWEALLYSFADQASYRAQTKTSCTALSLPAPLDLFDELTTRGWGTGSTGTQESPLLAANMTIDGTHQAQLMQYQLVNIVIPYLISKFVPSLAFRPAYPSGAGMATTTAAKASIATAVASTAQPLRLT